MSMVRRFARPMLASMFLAGGIDALRDPASKVPVAEDIAPRVAARLPGLDDRDTKALVRINGGVQVAAGTLLALGRMPRLSALALAATLVPTTAAAHRFWELENGERAQQQVHFLKNVSMLGGLLLTAVDTEGKPGIAWRVQHAADHTGAAARRARREARLAAKVARAKLPA